MRCGSNRHLRLDRRVVLIVLEFRETGMSEWLGLFYGFGWGLRHHQVEELGVIFSWTTDHPDGWTVAELSLLEELSALGARRRDARSGRKTDRRGAKVALPDRYAEMDAVSDFSPIALYILMIITRPD